MQSCFMCRKSDRVFNINHFFGQHCVKDDILEFCGNEIEACLENEDFVCNCCMNMLYHVANFKRKLVRHIYRRVSRYDGKPFTFDKVWDNFVMDGTLPTENDFEPCHSPSDNALLIPKYSIPSTQRSETDMIDSKKKYRNLSSRNSSGSFYRSDTPAVDREIEDVFESSARNRKKGRKRGFNWSRVKGARKSRARSRNPNSTTSSSRKKRRTYEYSPDYSSYAMSTTSHDTRPRSSLSQCSYRSISRPQSRVSFTSECAAAGLQYDHGELINRRTRSVSRLLEEAASKTDTFNYYYYFTCTEEDCTAAPFSTLEAYTVHKVQVHEVAALFWCKECYMRFITQSDLDKHNWTHHKKEILYCTRCVRRFDSIETLQEHFEDHLIHSVRCIYCDLDFTKKRFCDEHVRKVHKGKKKRTRQSETRSVMEKVQLKRIDSDVPNYDNNELYAVRILVQIGNNEDVANDAQDVPNDIQNVENGIQNVANDVQSVVNDIQNVANDVQNVANDVQNVPNDIQIVVNEDPQEELIQEEESVQVGQVNLLNGDDF